MTHDVYESVNQVTPRSNDGLALNMSLSREIVTCFHVRPREQISLQFEVSQIVLQENIFQAVIGKTSAICPGVNC